jgi:hypothetical protein
MSKTALLTLIILIHHLSGFTQDIHRKFGFVETELLVGAIVPNFPNYPQTGLSKGIQLSIGKTNTENSHWSNYYNKPTYGMSFNFTQSGNVKELGNEFGGLFFLEISPQRKTAQNFFFRFGIGTSYFSEHYRETSNESNTIIGSYWNWRFQAFMYRNLRLGNRNLYRIGAGYVHSSNGHTQLPNFGMNAAMLSISARFYSKENPFQTKNHFTREDWGEKKKRRSFMQLRSGIGMQEHGSTTEPIGGQKKAVYLSSLAYGWKLNNQLKIRTGLAYRYYQHFYDAIDSTETSLSKNQNWNASNVHFLLGFEFVIDHFSIDMEGGINLYKPYFSTFLKQYGGPGGIHQFMKKTFTTSLGLNYYLFDPALNKAFNVGIGAAINANFGQADFSQLNIALVKNFN